MIEAFAVVLEYQHAQNQVSVRGVFTSPVKLLPKLSEDNEQNYVDCQLNMDHKGHVGFTGLVPEDYLNQARAEIARLRAACEDARSALIDSPTTAGKVLEILNEALDEQ